MKHNFKLPEFPASTFDFEISVWTGKTKLFMDNQLLERSKEKGRPFFIPLDNGEYVKAFPKKNSLEVIPNLEINGSVHQIIERLTWYQYTLVAIPLLLILLGGMLGGGFGGVGSFLILSIFRKEQSNVSKYLKVIAVILTTYVAYYLIAINLIRLFRQG